MKHIYWIVLLVAAASCHTEDPVGMEFPAGTTACETRSDTFAETAPVQHVTMRNIGGIVVGEKIINSFTVKNMRDAFMTLYWTRIEYQALGHEPYPRKILYVDGQQFEFEIPNELNHQQMNLQDHKNDPVCKYYTPLYIDLIDDSNQKDYYATTNPSSAYVYPDDRISISNYGILYYCIGSSRNTTQLKSRLLENAKELGTNKKDINDYFAFYEQ